MTTTAPAAPRVRQGAHRPAPARVHPRPRRRLWPVLCVAAVVVVALVPRLVLVGFGLPDINHPDEPTNIGVGEAMVRNGSWLPHRYNYPSFLYDLIASVMRLGGLFGHHLGRRPVVLPQGLFIGRTTDPGLVIALRLCGVAASVAAAAVVTVVLLRVTGNRVAAVVAGGLLAISPTAIESGVYITPDSSTMLFCALALAGALAVLRRGTVGAYAGAGLAVGLAFSTKYNAALVVVALLVAHVLRFRSSLLRTPALGRLGLAVLTAVAATALTTPAWLAEPGKVWKGVLFEVMHYSYGQPGHEGSAPLAYARVLLQHEPLLLLLAVLGVVAGLVGGARRWRPPAEVLVVGSFAVAYLALIGSQTVSFDRNLLPVLPALAVLAGFGVAWAESRIRVVSDAHRRLFGLRAGAGVLGALAVAMAVLGGASTGRLQGDLDKPARVAAARWITTHLPSNSRIVEEGFGPWLEPSVWRGVDPRFAAFDGPLPADLNAVILTEDVDGLYSSDPHRYRRQLAAYAEIRRTRCVAAHFGGRGPWVEVLVPCRR